MLSTTQKTKLDNDNPTNQEISAGTELFNASNYALYYLICSVTADATGEKAVTVPFACEIVDVIVQARATSGGGTMTVKAGANAVTDAIRCAVDTTITRAGTINDAYSTLAAGATLTVDANGAADRGLVIIVVRRV